MTCHQALREVTIRALLLSPYDFTIVHGWRGEEVQNALVDSGASRAPWPTSKHNNIRWEDAGRNKQVSKPDSLAVDFGPWVNGAIPWNDTHIFAVIAGAFFAASFELNYPIRWGGDWDSDGSTKDQTLLDYGHVELIT